MFNNIEIKHYMVWVELTINAFKANCLKWSFYMTAKDKNQPILDMDNEVDSAQDIDNKLSINNVEPQ